MAHIQISYVGFIFINTIVFCKVATEFSVKKNETPGMLVLTLSKFWIVNAVRVINVPLFQSFDCPWCS